MSEERPSGLPRATQKTQFDWSFAIVAALSGCAMIWVTARDGFAVSWHILLEDAWLFATILPKVLLGCLVGGLARLLIARETIAKHIGENSGVKGLLIAMLIGALFPAGPFTIFPLAAVMLVSGADRGSAIAFISSWLLLGINRAIIWEMPFLGTDFVLFRMLISLPMPILLGLLARARVFDAFAAKVPPAL
ncbi:Predicted permease DUF318 [Rhabdaerophilaceae bacterium]